MHFLLESSSLCPIIRHKSYTTWLNNSAGHGRVYLGNVGCGSPGRQARFLHVVVIVGKALGSSIDKISHVQDGTTVCRPGPRTSGEICTARAAVCLIRSDLVFPSPMLLASDVQTIIGTRRSCCQIFSLVTSSASWCIIIRLLTSRLSAVGLHLSNGLGKWLQALQSRFLASM